MKQKNLIEKSLQRHSVCIENGISIAEISQEMGPVGYPPEEMEVGRSLLRLAIEASKKKDAEKADKLLATDALGVKFEEMDKLFARDLKMARIAFRDEPLVISAKLGIKRERSEIMGIWERQYECFYENALEDGTVKSALAVKGISEAHLQDRLEELEEFRQLKKQQVKEMGEAQLATEERDKHMAKLERWMSDYRQVARIVFEDRPQMLEMLGILVRN